jgi:pimeloyl-ACP methyl ester carboxylesterase
MTGTTTATATTDATATPPHDPPTWASTDLHVEVWGDGTPVVLVHGSLANGADEWAAQRPLVDDGFRLIVPDRRGCGRSPAADGEDFLLDADDLGDLMSTGAHLVGHSYGVLSAMIAAARWPEATLSLTLLEAPAASLAQHDPAWRSLVGDVRRLWQSDLADEDWVVEFLTAVGSDPAEFPADFLTTAVELVPVFRCGRPSHEADLPLDQLAAATFPKLVVSGVHHHGFEAMSDDLAIQIGASRAVIAGAGHEIQFTGVAINDALRALWSGSN